MASLNGIGIGKRLYLLSGTLTLLFIGMAGLGSRAIMSTEEHLANVFNNSLIPLEQLGRLQTALIDNRTILLSTDSNITPEVARRTGDAIAQNAQIATSNWDAYMASGLSPEEKTLADRFTTERAAWLSTGLKPAVESLKRGEASKARELVIQHSDLLHKVLETGEQLAALQLRYAKEERAAAEHTRAITDWLLWGGCALGVIFGMTLAMLITRSITGPVESLRQALDQLAGKHDLTTRLTPQGNDECARMAISFNSATQSLGATLRTIQQQSQELSASAHELAGAASIIREGTHAQSEAASATAASVEELAVSVSHVAQSANNATELATQSSAAADQGTTVVQSAAEEMSRIADDVRTSSAKAQSLAQRSNDISGIVQVIKDVADQTNLLALNAAIEAARAGEQGRGFAVVADEVRKLAERTTRSAAEITDLINVVQTDTRTVVATMESSIKRVDTGVQLAQQAAQSLEDIRSGAADTSGKIGDIATATREQSTASNDIARHVERIAQMTEENSAAASQSAALSERLESLASTLRDAVSTFKTA